MLVSTYSETYDIGGNGEYALTNTTQQEMAVNPVFVQSSRRYIGRQRAKMHNGNCCITMYPIPLLVASWLAPGTWFVLGLTRKSRFSPSGRSADACYDFSRLGFNGFMNNGGPQPQKVGMSVLFCSNRFRMSGAWDCSPSSTLGVLQNQILVGLTNSSGLVLV